MPYERLTLQVSDRIATLTVNRPDKLNALDTATIAELASAIGDVRTRDDIGGLILTGAGRAFCATPARREPTSLIVPLRTPPVWTAPRFYFAAMPTPSAAGKPFTSA